MASRPIGDARKTRVNIRSGCQVKEWLEFRWDHCERRYKYTRSLTYVSRGLYVQIKGDDDKRDTMREFFSSNLLKKDSTVAISTSVHCNGSNLSKKLPTSIKYYH